MGSISAAAANTPTSNAYPEWESALISKLGGNPAELPNTLEFLQLWSTAEGVDQSANNWIAVTSPPEYPLPNAGNLPGNPDYVATFPTTSDGVNGIATFLHNSSFIKNGQKQGLVDLMLNPDATVDQMAAALPVSLWGSDGAKIASWDNGSKLYPEATVKLGPRSEEYLASIGAPNFKPCDEGKTIIGTPRIGVGPLKTPGFNVLNQCQAKAIVGGLLVGIGGAIMLFGIITIGGGLVSQTSAGRAVLGTANPVKRVLGAARAQRTGSPTVTTAASPPPVRTVEPPSDAGRAAARRDWEAKHGKPWSESPAAQRQRAST